MNLFFIGYRCTGKTTIAKSVSEKMGWTFVDADVMLMEKRGENITRIVSNGGWALFRKLEKETLKTICSRDGQVVATGGGVVLDDENIEIMKMGGPVIWLRATAETVFRRMQSDIQTETLRPALTERDLMDEITQTLEEREPLYQKAMSWSVDTDGKGIMDVINEILIHLKKSGAY